MSQHHGSVEPDSADTTRLLVAESEKNRRLEHALRELREEVVQLADRVEKLTRPPAPYGIVVGRNEDETFDVLVNGRKLRQRLSLKNIFHHLLFQEEHQIIQIKK